MAPGTHITKHNGPTNKKLRVHLPLVVPPPPPAACGCSGSSAKDHREVMGTTHSGLCSECGEAIKGCRIRVGDAVHHWKAGTLMAFDDSFQHEAWNDTDAPRIVLIFDIWHPSLSPQEVRGAGWTVSRVPFVLYHTAVLIVGLGCVCVCVGGFR